MKAIAFEDPENLILQTTDLDLFKIFFSFWIMRAVALVEVVGQHQQSKQLSVPSYRAA